jgi:DNA recombination protein RmuC
MDGLWIVGGLVVGLGIGGTAIYFLGRPLLAKAVADTATQKDRAEAAEGARQKLAEDLAAAKVLAASATDLKRDLATKEETVTILKEERSSLLATLGEREKALSEEREQFNTLKDQFKDQFAALSADALREANKELQKVAEQIIDTHAKATTKDVLLNKSEIGKMLAPVGQTLERLDKQIVDTNKERAKIEGDLMGQIQRFASSNEKLSNALNKPVIRGSWAETKLEILLEGAGLVRDVDFQLHVSVEDDEGTRIVDALVNMAQGKRLVIDSKNLMQHYVAYMNEEEESTRSELLEKFCAAFKTTLKGLSIKDYSKHWEGIDAVIMFLPDEGMYLTAVESDRQLVALMNEKRVYVVSPNAMLPILNSVAYILGLERLNRDTQKIADAGRNMYASLRVLRDLLETLGDRIEGGVKAYNAVLGSFEGNLLPKARELSKIGAKQGGEVKELPEIDPEIREFKLRTQIELDGIVAALPAENGQADDEPSGSATGSEQTELVSD